MPRDSGNMHQRWRSVVFGVVTFLVTLLFIEALLQVAVRVSPRLDFILSHNQEGYLADDNLVWRPHPGHPDHDSNGFRNVVVPYRTEILALGDSQTYGTGVERDETWIHQLGALMGVDTYNMAYGGYGPVHSRVLLDEALELEPRVVVEAMYTGNDLYDSYMLVYVNERFPEQRTRDTKVLAAIDYAEGAHPGAPELHGLGGKEHDRRVGSMRAALSNHSRLYGFLRACRRVVERMGGDADPEPLFRQDWELLKKRAAARPDDFYVVESNTFKTILTPRYRLAVLNVRDPRVEEGLRLSLEAIRQMHDTTQSNGIHYLVLLIPTKELVFKDLAVVNGPLPESLRELVDTEEVVLERIREFLVYHDIAYVDALDALRDYMSKGMQPYNITHDGHPSAIGHRAIAETVRDAVAAKP